MKQNDEIKKPGSPETRDEAVARMKRRMEEDAKFPEGHPPPKSGMEMSDFRKAFLFTAIPIVGTSLLSMVSYFVPDLAWFWFAAPLGILIALVAGIINLVGGERGIAAGIFTGIGIGIVSAGFTCIANLNNVGL